MSLSFSVLTAFRECIRTLPKCRHQEKCYCALYTLSQALLYTYSPYIYIYIGHIYIYGLRKPPTTPFYRGGERDPEMDTPAHMKQPWNCRARIRASLFNHFVTCSQSGTPVSGH